MPKPGTAIKISMKWVGSSVHILYTMFSTLGEVVGTALPLANVVFTGIGVLLAVEAKDVWAGHDTLVDLFGCVQFFLKRLGVHTQISPTKDTNTQKKDAAPLH
ncbi:hypothetical protein EDB92DRAFT_1948616 [Lactarius akahatsu]|uniref:Uncharacterized protein n=1 Tax=Lactarius akahatsu TaxID=416441 RepID=A0AAD4QBD3_9AGAM|nr:hypothetical protein EDB92DRAFT_1948616 [Lactarius akahatsu]